MNSKKKILDTIRGKKEKVNDFRLTEDIISEDPFDIFYANSPITITEELEVEEFNTSLIEEVDATKIIESRNLTQDNDKENKTVNKENKIVNKENKKTVNNENKKTVNKENKKNKIIESRNLTQDYDKENKNNKTVKRENKIDVNSGSDFEETKIINSSIIKTVKSRKQKEISTIADDDFFAALTKSKEVKEIKVEMTPGIVNQVEIYTSKDLFINSIPMYKFPHIPDIKFEDGNLFKSLYSLFVRSLLSLFKSKTDFLLKYKAELIIFENNVMRATKGLERLLKNNDIEYEIKDLLIIRNVDINLVIDFLLNESLTTSYTIPFIMSKSKFINGIYYEINLKKDKFAVKDNDQILFKYILEGPFLNEDFREYFDYKHKIT